MQTPEPRNVVTLVLLVGGALISGLLLIDTRGDADRPDRPELGLAYYLDKAELIGTGADGRIVYHVWTDRAAQSTNDDSIELRGVRMEYEPPSGMPWNLQARAGRIPADASIIELLGNVVAVTRDEQRGAKTARKWSSTMTAAS